MPLRPVRFYAFGYTLLTGVLLNFVFGVGATRVMIRGAAGIPFLRKPLLYGAKSNAPIPVNEEPPKAKYNIMGNRRKFLAFSSAR